MAAQATKADIEALEQTLDTKIAALDQKIDATRNELRQEIDATRNELRQEIDATRNELREELHATRDDLRSEIRGVGIIVEDVRAQMRGLAEVMTGLVGRTEINEREDRITTRLTVLESSIRDNSDDIRKNTRRIAAVEKRLKRTR